MTLSQDGHLVRKQVLKLHENSFAETQDRKNLHESLVLDLKNTVIKVGVAKIVPSWCLVGQFRIRTSV